MKTTEEMVEVMTHFANGGEVEYTHSGLEHWCSAATPTWDWSYLDFRIKQPVDPYAELKAAAADPTKQIRMKHNIEWSDAGRDWSWTFAPEDYEIRDKPWKKKITMLAWFTGEGLTWMSEEYSPLEQWRRVPMQDKVIEVEV